jgi:uncharacterized protein YrrD
MPLELIDQAGKSSCGGGDLVENIEKLGNLIGRQVISVETANKVGRVNDLLADPVTGRFAGLAVEKLDEQIALVSFIDLHGIGPDAIMIEREECLVLVDASPLKSVPRVKANLMGVKIITEHGKLLGNISDAALCMVKDPKFIYEVRSSILDMLFGRAYYFPASLGCAFADDGSALVISDDAAAMEHNLEAAAKRLLGSLDVAPLKRPPIKVEIRSQTSPVSR